MWVNEKKNLCRIIVILIVFVAFTGPWLYESLYVPGNNECQPPAFRVRENFCGWPMTGLTAIFWIGGGVFSVAGRVHTGVQAFTDNPREFLTILFLLPLLPLFNSLFLILRPNRRNVFQVVTWGLAIGVSVWVVIIGWKAPFGAMWGIWLYAAVAAAALMLEILLLWMDRSDNLESRPAQ